MPYTLTPASHTRRAMPRRHPATRGFSYAAFYMARGASVAQCRANLAAHYSQHLRGALPPAPLHLHGNCVALAS